MRFRSLADLGRGAWKIAQSAPLRPARSAAQERTAGALRATRRTGPTPHDLLWAAVRARWPQAQREMTDVVSGRRYRLDIGFREERLAIEVDGFAHHGKYVADFRRDRQRQNELVIAGWRVLRFSAGEIRKEVEACLATISRALESVAFNATAGGRDGQDQ